LALKVVGIDPTKSFKEIDAQLASKKKVDFKLSLKKVYGGLNAKSSLLLKTYSANFNKLLKH
jgi:hypothetical protein